VACTGGSAWQGFVKIGSNTLPYTSADIAEKRNVIASENLYGGSNSLYRSYKNISSTKSIVEGSLACEIFATGGYASALNSLISAAIDSDVCDGFDGDSAILFSPAGGSAIKVPGTDGKCVVNSMSLRGNNGGISSASFNIISTNYEWLSDGTASLQFETAGSTNDENPAPWYETSFSVAGTDDSSLINTLLSEWEITVNNNFVPTYTLCGIDEDNGPTFLRPGKMDVIGSFSYFSPTGVFADSLTNGASFVLDIGVRTLRSPYMFFLTAPTPVSSSNQIVVRNVSFRCFSDGSNPSLY
jgi:hypothetical protein